MGKSHRKLFIILGALQAFVALGAIPAGFSIIFKPDGSGLGMTLDILKNSPFKDFLIPGLFLFIVNGILNLVASVLSFLKYKLAGQFGILLGMFLMLWIIIQVYFISLSSFLQPLMFIIGLIGVIISYVIYKRSKLKLN